MSTKKKKSSKIKKEPMILVTTSDNHMGFQSLEQVTKEYYDEETGFFAKLEEMKNYCDEEGIRFAGVAITGDFFDRPLAFNSPIAKFAMDLIHALAVIVIEQYGGKVIIIQGTRSHDLNQIMMFEPFAYEYEGDFLIFNTVDEFNLYGYDVLCIPEEYMKNQQEYYAPYFSKKYDMILGHGLMISSFV